MRQKIASVTCRMRQKVRLLDTGRNTCNHVHDKNLRRFSHRQPADFLRIYSMLQFSARAKNTRGMPPIHVG
jgi:hypothetical protein